MERVQETLEQVRSRAVTCIHTTSVTISTMQQDTDDGLKVITAMAEWYDVPSNNNFTAEATRTLDTAGHDELTIKQVIDASKRDALRELVTQLQLHEVL